VKTVVIPFRDQREASIVGIQMSHWCKERGLEREKDYSWAFLTDCKEIHFQFYNESESFSTMFALKWAGNEI